MKFISLIITCLFVTQFVSAQTLKGRVIDTKGEPIVAASIYIKEIKQGLICDKDGNFQIKLNTGTYTIECTCIGYNYNTKKITITNENLDVEFILSEKALQLQEVVIQAG